MTAQRPRSPGIVFGSIALALIVLLAIFALSQRQPPPPTIAEFAPQGVCRGMVTGPVTGRWSCCWGEDASVGVCELVGLSDGVVDDGEQPVGASGWL